MFKLFTQNNSGGHFNHDPRRGIGPYVIVEGTDEEDCVQRAEDIGLYWNGVDEGSDCECCGDRWDTYGEVSDEPQVYGEPVSQARVRREGKPLGYIHYLSGGVEVF